MPAGDSTAGTTVQHRAARGLSRRTMLKAGAVTAGAVWVAPVVESVTSSAAAQSAPPSPGEGFSSVTVLLSFPSGSGTDYYRLKFDYSAVSGLTAGTCLPAPVSGNDTSFRNGPCFRSDDPTQPSKPSAVTKAVATSLSAQYCLNSDRVPYFTITNSTNSSLHTTTYTLAGWVVHQGRCCFGGSSTAPATLFGSSNPSGSSYAGPTGSLAPGGTITFPAASCG